MERTCNSYSFSSIVKIYSFCSLRYTPYVRVRLHRRKTIFFMFEKTIKILNLYLDWVWFKSFSKKQVHFVKNLKMERNLVFVKIFVQNILVGPWEYNILESNNLYTCIANILFTCIANILFTFITSCLHPLFFLNAKANKQLIIKEKNQYTCTKLTKTQRRVELNS